MKCRNLTVTAKLNYAHKSYQNTTDSFSFPDGGLRKTKRLTIEKLEKLDCPSVIFGTGLSCLVPHRQSLSLLIQGKGLQIT